MASKNLGGNRMALSAQPGKEVIGSAPRIPAVAPGGPHGVTTRPGVIDALAYGLAEGDARRFSEDLNGLDGRRGDIPSVSPSAPPMHNFAESDYNQSTVDNDGHIAAVRSSR